MYRNLPGMESFIQQRIEWAIHEGSTALDLRKLNLFHIPDTVLQQQWVKAIDLSSDAIIDKRSALIDEEFWWEVSHDNNVIHNLPDSIAELSQLEVLKLNQVELQVLPANLGKLQNLRVLELRNNFIKELPKSFASLKNLEYLDLSFNLFEEFPTAILGCENLRYLNMGSNKVKRIPTAIGKLVNLQTLDFSNFDIEKAFAETVERFELCNNSIGSVPASTKNLKQLNRIIL